MESRKILFALVTTKDNRITLSEMRNQTGKANDLFASSAQTNDDVIAVSFARYTEFELSAFAFHPRYKIRRN